MEGGGIRLAEAIASAKMQVAREHMNERLRPLQDSSEVQIELSQ